MTKTDDGTDIEVIGKGGKHRKVYINDGALAAFTDWLGLRGGDPGTLFVDIPKAARSARAERQAKPSARCYTSAARKRSSQSQ